MTVTRDVYQPG